METGLVLPPERLLTLRAEGDIAYSENDAMLYALSVGMGADPLDPQELPFVYESNLKLLPSFAAALMLRGPPLSLGINSQQAVHGEQRLTIHRPLPRAAHLTAVKRIVGVADKGAEKGTLVFVETILAESGQPVASLLATIYARADGGGGSGGLTPPGLPKAPHRSADFDLAIPTRPDQALLYRLTGDRNPLHADPGFAQGAGFPRPILHGLCTYAIACRAVIQTFCNFDPSRILQFDARFSAPVFPGETISVRMWKDGANVHFSAAIESRSVTVLDNGLAVLAE
jgi:acyl dehydratase